MALELLLCAFKDILDSESRGQFHEFNHLSGVLNLVDYYNVAEVAVVNNLFERLILDLLLEVNYHFSLLIALLGPSIEELLPENLGFVGYNSHMALNLQVASGPLFGSPESVYLLELLSGRSVGITSPSPALGRVGSRALVVSIRMEVALALDQLILILSPHHIDICIR